jgi:replication-associated recombination protein RarA
MIDQLFTEKFRPKTLKDIILPERIRKELGDGKLHQNYLLYSSPGTGKCVTGDTTITVLNEETNEEFDISINDFIILCQSQK